VKGRAGRWWALAPSVTLGMAAMVLAIAMGIEAVAPRRSAAAAPGDKKLLDPTSWGGDHVGQEIPQYMDSGECLFCHRAAVGVSWQRNKHNLTIREPEAAEPALAALRAEAATKPFADRVQLILGDTRAQRFLRRSQAYGKVDLLSTGVVFGRGRRAKLDSVEKPRWDAETFARECAGCHATAVDPQTHAFAALSLDCFSCHGDAPTEHANDARLMPLAKARKDSAAVVTSICASCHVRFGKSRATGLPYPTNFVAGDNLFKDFQVDFRAADDAKLNPADRHVMENVRDVVLLGQQSMTCLSCHDVHSGTSKKHRDLASGQYCLHCHDAGQPIKGHKAYEVHSQRCRY
jgi:predicted CXXCH cytochrome family protein